MLILYGTETGCAQEIAERVGREAKRHLLAPRVVSMDSYDVGQLPDESLILAICSTTGDGEVPSNMALFWRFLLRRDLSTQKGGGAGALANVKFAVFGLGDSAYAQFNVVARKLHARLEQLGAVAMHPLTLGDDQSSNGLAGDVDVWLDAFWQSVLSIKPLPHGYVVDNSSALPNLDYNVISMDSSVDTDISGTNSDALRHESKFYQPPKRSCRGGGKLPHQCHVLSNNRITASDWHQDVRHIVLSVSDPSKNGTLEYVAGDIAVIYPENVFDVDDFARQMGYNPDRIFRLEHVGNCDEQLLSTGKNDDSLRLFPTPCTVRKALQCYLDVLGTPKRYAVELLSHFATDPVEKEKLLEIGASTEGVDLYHSYLKREKRGFTELFADFPSCRPPLEWLIQIVPLLRPREYSIASSPRCFPKEIHLAVAIVDFVSYYGQERRGICTNWMSGLRGKKNKEATKESTNTGDLDCQNNDSVFLYVKRGRIGPAPLEVPELLIGPGTGIAPIMSLIQDRYALRSVNKDTELSSSHLDGERLGNEDSKSGYTDVQDMVFFGCRHEAQDFLFRDKLLNLCRSDISLTSDEKTESRTVQKIKQAQLCVAFSRDQEHKVYVQHKLAEHADKVWAILDPKQGNGRVVISGSSQGMPRDVLAVLKRIAVMKGQLTAQQAERFFKTLQRRGKYILEAW